MISACVFFIFKSTEQKEGNFSLVPIHLLGTNYRGVAYLKGWGLACLDSTERRSYVNLPFFTRPLPSHEEHEEQESRWRGLGLGYFILVSF